MSILRSTKQYFLRRLDSPQVWFGVFAVIGEIVLHAHSSTLMLVFFLAMIFVPDESFRSLFLGWASALRKADYEHQGRNRPKTGGFKTPQN